jgi:hypothetical protein
MAKSRTKEALPGELDRHMLFLGLKFDSVLICHDKGLQPQHASVLNGGFCANSERFELVPCCQAEKPKNV